MGASYGETVRKILISGNFAGRRRHRTEREIIGGDKSEQSTRFQILKLHVKQQTFLCRVWMITDVR